MWHVNVSNPLKVAVTRLPRADADLIFAALKELRTDPLAGRVYALGGRLLPRSRGLSDLLRLGSQPARSERHRRRASTLTPPLPPPLAVTSSRAGPPR